MITLQPMRCGWTDCTSQPKHKFKCGLNKTFSCTDHIEDHLNLFETYPYYKFIGTSQSAWDAVYGYVLYEKHKNSKEKLDDYSVFRPKSEGKGPDIIKSLDLENKVLNDILESIKYQNEEGRKLGLFKLDAQHAIGAVKKIISLNIAYEEKLDELKGIKNAFSDTISNTVSSLNENKKSINTIQIKIKEMRKEMSEIQKQFGLLLEMQAKSQKKASDFQDKTSNFLWIQSRFIWLLVFIFFCLFICQFFKSHNVSTSDGTRYMAEDL